MTGFRCRKDCAECCGIFPIPAEIWERHEKDVVRKVTERVLTSKNDCIPLTDDDLCPFLKGDKTCAIYEDRPQTCRDFGLVENLPCPYFKPSGHERSPGSRRQVDRRQKRRIEEFMKTMGHRRPGP